MALYRTGTAAMDAQGVITGTGTKWREPLSLIRTGATIVFLTTPLKLAVISDIVSDTEMKAIQTDGEPVENGNYVILLNDSLTVDGMAQDVAETLRYYQSKETVIEEAIEFLKNFDLKQLQDLVAMAEASAQKTDADRQATEQLKNDTQIIKDAAVNETQQIKDAAVNETQQIKDAAIAETNQIKADTDAIKNQTQQIKDSAVTEITGIKNEALDARDEAENAQFAAEQSKVGADNAKASAETARDEARQWAQQVNPENLLHKDQNLNDIQDKNAAKISLFLDRFNQGAGETFIQSPDKIKYLTVGNDGWGYWNTQSQQFIPLGVKQGGTGATTVTEARKNLLVDSVDKSGDQTIIWAPDKDTYFFAYSTGDWGVYDISAEVRKPLPISSGGTGGTDQHTARKALGISSEDDVWFNTVITKQAITGVGGAFSPVIRKLKDQQSTDGAKNNYLSIVENSDCGVVNYIFTRVNTGISEYSWNFRKSDGQQSWYGMRSDGTMHTPFGQVAIQGSDVRIKDRFELPKPGAWDRVKNIGVMEFYYKGNHVLQRGYLAQQMAEIDDTYVFFGGTATDENGDEFEIMNVNDRAVVSDLIVVIQELQKDNEEMKEEIAEMKTAMAEMKAMLVQLAK